MSGSMPTGAFILLSLLSLTGLNRTRAVPVGCDHGIIAWRLVAKEGTLVTYAGVTHRVGANGALEILADSSVEVIRVGARTHRLPSVAIPDAFGVVTLRLPAR